MERLLTVDDVMEIIQVSRRTAYTYMQSMLHMVRPLRVTETALRSWIAERMEAPAGNPAEKKRQMRHMHRNEPVMRIERRKAGQST